MEDEKQDGASSPSTSNELAIIEPVDGELETTQETTFLENLFQISLNIGIANQGLLSIALCWELFGEEREQEPEADDIVLLLLIVSLCLLVGRYSYNSIRRLIAQFSLFDLLALPSQLRMATHKVVHCDFSAIDLIRQPINGLTALATVHATYAFFRLGIVSYEIIIPKLFNTERAPGPLLTFGDALYLLMTNETLQIISVSPVILPDLLSLGNVHHFYFWRVPSSIVNKLRQLFVESPAQRQTRREAIRAFRYHQSRLVNPDTANVECAYLREHLHDCRAQSLAKLMADTPDEKDDPCRTIINPQREILTTSLYLAIIGFINYHGAWVFKALLEDGKYPEIPTSGSAMRISISLFWTLSTMGGVIRLQRHMRGSPSLFNRSTRNIMLATSMRDSVATYVPLVATLRFFLNRADISDTSSEGIWRMLSAALAVIPAVMGGNYTINEIRQMRQLPRTARNGRAIEIHGLFGKLSSFEMQVNWGGKAFFKVEQTEAQSPTTSSRLELTST